MRKLIVLALALLISTPSFGDHPPPPPPPPPPPVETPVAATALAWLFCLMAAPIIGFAIQHYMATKDEKK